MNINNLMASNANIQVVVGLQDLKEFMYEVLGEAGFTKQEREDVLLTPNEVSKTLGVDKTTLWRWEKNKQLVPIRIGCKVRYKSSDVEQIKRVGL